MREAANVMGDCGQEGLSGEELEQLRHAQTHQKAQPMRRAYEYVHDLDGASSF